jgi:hypothetical protein
MDNGQQAPVHILWTGGWDSTFELLRLLLVHRVPAQPVYLIDGKRPSLQVELRTMDRIRTRLLELYPHTAGLLLPTLTARVEEVPLDPGVTEAFRRLQARAPIGSQYEWLASFCLQHGLSEVELGAEKTRSGAGALVAPEIVRPTRARGGYETHRIVPGLDPDMDVVFGRYSLPLFEMTKQDMASEVDERGWRPLMLETWFCHQPTGGLPCGRCNPCHGVVKAGLGWRIPLRRRLLGAVHGSTIGWARRTARRLLLRMRGSLASPGAGA